MTRRARKVEHWPEADRAMWASLTAGGHILDEAGAGSHWRPNTRLIFMRDYGYWLAFLCEAGVDLQAEQPLARLTPLKMQAFILTLADLAPSSRACIIRSLAVIAVRAYPTSSWQWLQALRRPLDAAERAQQGLRKAQKIISSHLLIDVGLEIMRAATSDCSQSACGRAVDFRDGLAIALLASRPLRIRDRKSTRLNSSHG